MKYLLLALIVIGVVFLYYTKTQSTDASGKLANISSGVISYGKDSLASLKGNGLVSLDGTFVRGMLEVNGSLDAKDAHIGTLLTNGHASFVGCVVDGKAEINGFTSGINATFQAPLTLTCRKATFENCNLSAVTVKKTGWSFGSQELILSKKTICKGPITFEAGNGKVIVSKDSQILGKVIGAEVVAQ